MLLLKPDLITGLVNQLKTNSVTRENERRRRRLKRPMATTTTTYKKIVDNVIDRLNNPLAGRKTKKDIHEREKKKKIPNCHRENEIEKKEMCWCCCVSLSLSLRFRRVRRAHNIPFRFLPLKERVGSRGGESLDLFGNGSLCSAALTRETDCLLRLQQARRPPPSTAQTLDVLCRDAAVCFSCVCFNFFPLEGKKRYLCYVFFSKRPECGY